MGKELGGRKKQGKATRSWRGKRGRKREDLGRAWKKGVESKKRGGCARVSGEERKEEK